MKTRTGAYRIGMRAGSSPWQKDLTHLAGWAKTSGFELIDLTQVDTGQVRSVQSPGLDVISVDLTTWPALLSADGGRRRDAVATNRARIREMAGAGVRIFFAVVVPENPEAELRQNFDLAVGSYGELAREAESVEAAIVLEGWPGQASPYANLCCNPEQYRAMLKEVASPGLMINYDPSHLIRMGIDPVRFIEEFAARVGHVHGKDCEILTDALYEVGLYQKSLLHPPHRYGEFSWRYTIPGHGITRWSHVLEVLHSAGYRGAISVELEDENYNGSEEGEKAGLLASLAYLQTV
jgi:sugar phosphate isomerase/epimerase